VIDAQLDDAGWQGATVVTGFVELVPREGAAPPVQTEARLTYDDRNLYIAIAAKDPDPRQIRATLQPRDRLFSDDWVGCWWTPSATGRWGITSFPTPSACRRTLQMTRRARTSPSHYVFNTAGKITADGYNVEMAIPFRSLRFPNRPVQQWKIMLVRTYPRSNRHYISLPLAQPEQLLPASASSPSCAASSGCARGAGLEMIPAVIASRAGALTDADDPSRTGRATHGRRVAHAALRLSRAGRPSRPR
jgi:hypothetical protein